MNAASAEPKRQQKKGDEEDAELQRRWGTFAGEDLVARAIVDAGLGFHTIFLALEPDWSHLRE